MSYCSIRWCGKTSKRSNSKTDGISFHRFPKEPGQKEKWIDCTRRENWFPSNYSVVCSRHFTEDSFYTKNHRRRLFDTAIPTLHLPLVSNTKVISECVPESASPRTSSQHDPLSSADPEIPSQFHTSMKKRLCRCTLELSSQVKDKNKTIKVNINSTEPVTSYYVYRNISQNRVNWAEPSTSQSTSFTARMKKLINKCSLNKRLKKSNKI